MKQIIVDTYPMYGINETIKKLGLTENEKHLIQRQAQILHLKRIGKYFTEKEIQYLKENYASKTVNEITSILHKNKSAVTHMACKLGLSNDIYYYSDQDIQFLKDNYNKLSNQQLADKLGKTLSAIETKISKLGLTKDVIWTDKEIRILKEVYPNYTNKKIAKDYLLNRNDKSINTMAHKFNLTKSKIKSVKWYDKNDMLNDLYEASKLLGRTPYESELSELNLPSGKTYDRYFGTYSQACIEADIIPNSQAFGKSIGMIASDGTKCLSKSEYIVCEYFISHNIPYTKEDYYKDYINDIRCKNKRFDWIVRDY